jgi:hypothetical protein
LDRGASLIDLQKAFGAANVTSEQVDGAEGDKVTVTVLFARQKERRLAISWVDETRHKGISQFTFGKGAAWVIGGVHIGSTLAEVVEANGRAFTLSGFDWDYGGTVTDWHGGRMEQQPGGCRVGVRFDAARDAPAAVRDKTAGDKDFTSSDANMRAARPTVYEIFVGYPD